MPDSLVEYGLGSTDLKESGGSNKANIMMLHLRARLSMRMKKLSRPQLQLLVQLCASSGPFLGFSFGGFPSYVIILLLELG